MTIPALMMPSLLVVAGMAVGCCARSSPSKDVKPDSRANAIDGGGGAKVIDATIDRGTGTYRVSMTNTEPFSVGFFNNFTEHSAVPETGEHVYYFKSNPPGFNFQAVPPEARPTEDAAYMWSKPSSLSPEQWSCDFRLLHSGDSLAGDFSIEAGMRRLFRYATDEEVAMLVRDLAFVRVPVLVLWHPDPKRECISY